MKSILLYNLFPRTIWKEVTASLLRIVPHDEIVVHVSMPLEAWLFKAGITRYLKSFTKVTTIFFSMNSKKMGETKGFEKIRKKIDFSSVDVVTYIHSKGTSRRRKNNKPVADWTEYMRYFVVERFDLCLRAFSQGYDLYGVDLSSNKDIGDVNLYPDSKFHYSGNFVSCNLQKLRERFLSAPVVPRYYGIERFWGTLCPMEKAFCAFQSKTDHYQFEYPPGNYLRP